MVTIGLRFLAGRFHATPWGRHVNEGVAEWPPSPWRLLRALIATAKRTLPAVTDSELAALMAPLAAAPEIWVPSAAPGHTRHWMPWFKKGPGDRTLVFDTFAAVQSEEALYLHWPNVALPHAEAELLRAILANFTYLGRAESWCEAWLADQPTGALCAPVSEETVTERDVVALLCAEGGEPTAVLNALLVETTQMREVERQLLPRGSQWVRYGRPTTTWIDFPVPAPRQTVSSPVTMLRFALDGKPLPRWTDALRLGELARRAVLSRLGEGGKRELPAHLVGHDEGNPARLQHQHPFFLPEDLRGRGHIDHLLIWFPTGLGEEELARLLTLSELRSGEEVRKLLFLGGWSAEAVQAGQGPIQASSVWESVTPYVFTRYPKRHSSGAPKLNALGEQVDGGEEQIRREWQLRQSVRPDLPDLVEILPLPAHELAGRSIAWREFRRWRELGERPVPFFGGYRLRFGAPVLEPVALGYGAHLGLGQFRPGRE